MLRATDLDAGYGELTVLHRVSLEVQEGEILSVIGPNGAGKTTLLRTLAGLTAATAGTVAYRDEDITAMSVPERVRRGISLVPEERHLFRDMTVRENLTLGSFTARDRKEDIIQRVFDLFPRLSERSDQHAGTLSGGEAQMLTIGRGLMTDPEVLLMDEPSLGLAPKLVPELFEKVRQINDEGISIVIVEQQIDRALELADTGCLLENGEITMRGRATELMNDPEVVEKYLGGE